MLVAAYKSIYWVQDHDFWRKLAAICVKTKRTDVAAYCFGRMQDACGVQLIEKAEKEPVTLNDSFGATVFGSLNLKSSENYDVGPYEIGRLQARNI